MNYKDVEKIKEDAETLFNKNSFIREVLIGNNNFPKDEVSQRVNVTVVLSHEESMKFKDYTKEDFEGTKIYTYGILNIVDLTHVYKEIIDSGNQYYDSSKYRKVLMITLKQNSLVSAYLINEIRFDSINFDFIDGGGYYPYVSESEYRYE